MAAAAVTFKMTSPGGTVTKTATTNTSGVAKWSYKTAQKGIHSVTVVAASGGTSATGGPATFAAY